MEVIGEAESSEESPAAGLTEEATANSKRPSDWREGWPSSLTFTHTQIYRLNWRLCRIAFHQHSLFASAATRNLCKFQSAYSQKKKKRYLKFIQLNHCSNGNACVNLKYIKTTFANIMSFHHMRNALKPYEFITCYMLC